MQPSEERALKGSAELLLTASIHYLLTRGCAPDMLVKALKAMTAALESDANIGNKKIVTRYEYMSHAARVLRDWSADHRFTDDNGRPLPLALRGRSNSLTQLMGRYFPRSKIAWGLQWMEEAGHLTRNGDGLYMPNMRAAIFYKQNSETTERTVTLARRILQTAQHNAAADDKRTMNFDRSSDVPRIPAKHMARFRAFLTAQAQAFLEIIDDWLESHSDSTTAEPTVDVGVHLYLHTNK